MVRAKETLKIATVIILIFVFMASWVLISSCGKKASSELSQSQSTATVEQTASAGPGGISQAGLDFGAAYRSCQSNLKSIATACEMYSTENMGRYPTSLKQLIPGYMRSIPVCPAAGRDTYSSSYSSAINPDMFTVCCSGNNHKEMNAGENYPLYTSSQGLIPGQGGK